MGGARITQLQQSVYLESSAYARALAITSETSINVLHATGRTGGANQVEWFDGLAP